jgi:chromosome segregation ATPase
MAKPSVLAQPVREAVAATLPAVRLEVRAGANRPTRYEVGEDGFLIGSVPGCDLRLPGGNLPPVLCLIVRHVDGACLRKLAPVQHVVVNGRAVTSTALNSGDKIAIGSVEIVVQIGPSAKPGLAVLSPNPDSGANLRHEAGQLTARSAQLQDQMRAFATERAAWETRRAEMEAEYRSQTEALEETSQRLRRLESELAAARVSLDAREQAWRERQERSGANGEKTARQAEELLAWRKDLEQLKHQLHERFRQKRERLAKMGKAVRRAALRVQVQKHEAAEEAKRLAVVRQQTVEAQTALEAQREQREREQRVLEEQHQIMATRQQDLQRDKAARITDVETRERKLAEEKTALEKGQQQYQADLVRLDRAQGLLEKRQQQLQDRARDVDRRSELLQRDSRELEEQAAQLDELREKLVREHAAVEPRQKELADTGLKLDQRAGALESQQAMLATLRTRMERLRDELRQQEQALAEQRVAQEAAEADLRRRAEEVRQLRLELASEKDLFEKERRRFAERCATVDQAVAELRQAQDAQAPAQAELRRRQEELDATAAQQAEQAGVLLARGQQLDELHARAAGDSQALREREAALARAEATLATLQEQLRRRGEELSERERRLADQERRLSADMAGHDAAAREWEAHRQAGTDGLEAARRELNTRAAEVDALQQEALRHQEAVAVARTKIDEESGALEAQKRGLQAERVAFERERHEVNASAAQRTAELQAARTELLEIGRQLPDLEARGAAAVDKLLLGRAQLRDQLAEVHAYTRQARADLEGARHQLQAESERLRQWELELHGQRDEHRLAVAAYRQQLVEWQGHLTEMRQALARGESQLDRRHAEVEERAQRVAAAGVELAQQAEQLHVAEREVAQQRGEMTRHLSDMREWYRKKMRELSGIDAASTAEHEGDVVRLPDLGAGEPAGDAAPAQAERGILALTGAVDPGDRQLGDLLRSLELIDADTLTALLADARRQRRTLRQLLLAGSYLTLYQMALIEAGSIDGLVLGPVRIIDRLKATAREAAYRVFDPRHNREALLRHLGESEMLDAVGPDEFRQRFGAAAAVQHAHIAATYEVLEIAGRPAVLQEWLTGVPSAEWPVLAAVAGVWYRLLAQAALALHTAHEAGLIHGHLGPASFVLTGDGVLKVCGFGEPRWLRTAAPVVEAEPTALGDLQALGRVAAEWAASTPERQGAKPRPLPKALQEILRRLESDQPGEHFESAAAVLQALDQTGAGIPANAAAWERFVTEVQAQCEDVALRRTA